MQSTKKHFTLNDNEYIVTGGSPNSLKYKVLYDGKDVTDSVIALIRINK